jgi:hypothetical protein
LNLDAGQGAAHEMLSMKDAALQLLVARLDDLATVILAKPGREIGQDVIRPNPHQGGVLADGANLEPLESDLERIRTPVHRVVGPRGHLGGVPYALPGRLVGDPGAQGLRGLVTEGFGIDLVTHLDQPGQIGSTAEATVHSHAAPGWIGVLAILRLQV